MLKMYYKKIEKCFRNSNLIIILKYEIHNNFNLHFSFIRVETDALFVY